MPVHPLQVSVAAAVQEAPVVGAALLDLAAHHRTAHGEVLYWEGECLHWHHICCTPGASLLPPAPDRWLINTLRRLGLGGPERTTYRNEAEQMRDWLQSPPEATDYDIFG